MTEKTFKIIEVVIMGLGTIASGLVALLVDDKATVASLCSGITALTSAILCFCEPFVKRVAEAVEVLMKK